MDYYYSRIIAFLESNISFHNVDSSFDKFYFSIGEQ